MLVISGDVRELCNFFKTTCVEEARERLRSMEIHDVPDGLSVPSLVVGYARTGDYLYVPMGALTVCKAINGNTISLRPGPL